jgi:hypothetical protein
MAGFLTIMLLLPLAPVAQEPPLPPGLSAPSESTAEPALPPGLGAPSTDPALPPGLGAPSTDPALPTGLGAPSADPALPPGLGSTEDPTDPTDPSDPSDPSALSLQERLPFPIHGFWETRGALRLQGDPAHSKGYTLGETRLQLETSKNWDRANFAWKSDFLLDGVREQADFDLREARLTLSLTDTLDLRIGRQVLTWGTGDLIFINDLFPKDWQSFLGGREVEYLKAPSDALKLGWYPGWLNFEFVYHPQFAPDRFPTGEYITFFNPVFDNYYGDDNQVNDNAPSDWFSDDEFALRVYRNIGNWEVAAYGYAGYWKSPGGFRLIPPLQAGFPKLNVYGASIRGTVGKGVVNAEVGYYESRQDTIGTNPLINNSEFRVMAGYERELAKNLTGSMQVYLEHMMDYDNYRNTLPFFIEARDEDRLLVTLRLTKLAMQQNLMLSWFSYYSPTDNDAFFLPKATYKINDRWTIEGGANIFVGEEEYSFFGQFENNSNVFFGARYAW